MPAVDGSSSFSSTVYTNNLDTNSPYEVHKAMIDGFRTESPDIRIVGNVINTLPADDTTLSFEFEGNTYKLKTLGRFSLEHFYHYRFNRNKNFDEMNYKEKFPEDIVLLNACYKNT